MSSGKLQDERSAHKMSHLGTNLIKEVQDAETPMFIFRRLIIVKRAILPKN